MIFALVGGIMLRVFTIVVTSLLLGINTHAADSEKCFSESDRLASGKDIYEEAIPTKLSRIQERNLRSLFRSLKGDWKGKSVGFFCLGSESNPRIKFDNFFVTGEVPRDFDDNFQLEAKFEDDERGIKRQEKVRLFVNEGYLRFDNRNKRGDVELISVEKRSLTFSAISRRSNGQGNLGPVQEIRFTLIFDGSWLRLKYKVYIQGILASVANWSLHRD